jgi:hypothetical protein
LFLCCKVPPCTSSVFLNPSLSIPLIPLLQRKGIKRRQFMRLKGTVYGYFLLQIFPSMNQFP